MTRPDACLGGHVVQTGRGKTCARKLAGGAVFVVFEPKREVPPPRKETRASALCPHPSALCSQLRTCRRSHQCWTRPMNLSVGIRDASQHSYEAVAIPKDRYDCLGNKFG
jgi:hypothetical protein